MSMDVRRAFIRLVSVTITSVVVMAGPNAAPTDSSRSTPTATPMAPSQREALELGHKVLAIQHALQHPGEPDAMKAITDLGHDQRYYGMVRGWLSHELQGDQSLLDANKEHTPLAVKERIRFLQQAIRAIDLE